MKTWDMVQEYFTHNGEACADCPFLKTTSQRHPYGSTTATEELSECELLNSNSPADSPDDCRGLEDFDDEE